MGWETKLTGRIVVPGDPDYNEARRDFNTLFSKYPRVIVFCQEVRDVVNAVKWARKHGIPMRARCGRHSYEAGKLFTPMKTNLDRLRRIKRKYDPDNVFCFEQSITPV